MSISPSLLTLVRHMAGEFDNREQALTEPIWYVHLRLWQRPVPLFMEDSLTLFAEQANVLSSDNPYRQRLLRLRQTTNPQAPLQGQYYCFKEPESFRGAGRKPEVLQRITLDDVELLPGCVLNITEPKPLTFVAAPPADTCCFFTYQGETRQVVLGFEANATGFMSYDRGVEKETGKTLWGAMMGPYQFTKRLDFSGELQIAASAPRT